jgi:FAD/FMN-containing dehydrogenase
MKMATQPPTETHNPDSTQPERNGLNFLGEKGDTQVRNAYPGETWKKLAAIKALYDPENLFRVNHNIPPIQ